MQIKGRYGMRVGGERVHSPEGVNQARGVCQHGLRKGEGSTSHEEERQKKMSQVTNNVIEV